MSSDGLYRGLGQWWRKPSVRQKLGLLVLWVAVFACLYYFRAILLPFVGAVLLAYVIEPAVTGISSLRWARLQFPRWLAVILLYLVFFGLFTWLIVAVVPRLHGELQRVTQSAHHLTTRLDDKSIESYTRDLERLLFPPEVLAPVIDRTDGEPLSEWLSPPTGTGRVPEDPGAAWVWKDPVPPRRDRPVVSDGLPLPAPPRLNLTGAVRDATGRVKQSIREGLGQLVGLVRGIAVALADVLVGALLLFMLTAFITIDTVRIRRFTMSLVPVEWHEGADRLLERIDAGLGGVVRGQLTIMAINGALTFVGLALFGVKFAFFLGLVATIFYIVPIFGTILSSVPIVLVALADSVSKALAILLWIVGIHALEAYYLNPKILGDAARIHPVLIVFALVAGENLGGVVGALLGVPAMSVALAVFRSIHRGATEIEGTGEAGL